MLSSLRSVDHPRLCSADQTLHAVLTSKRANLDLYLSLVDDQQTSWGSSAHPCCVRLATTQMRSLGVKRRSNSYDYVSVRVRRGVPKNRQYAASLLLSSASLVFAVFSCEQILKTFLRMEFEL